MKAKMAQYTVDVNGKEIARTQLDSKLKVSGWRQEIEI